MSSGVERVVVVDHGAGNLPNVVRAVTHLGSPPRVSSDPEVVARADRLILPGVGAFGDCVQALRRSGLVEALEVFRGRGQPLLGICVGLQVLFESSDEFGPVAGLGFLSGHVRQIPAHPGVKVPHMGWSRVRWLRDHPVLGAAGADPYVYFVHSYHAEPEDPEVVAGVVDARQDEARVDPPRLPVPPIIAAVASGPLLATQFHPEKSSRAGLAIMKAFLGWAP